MLTEPCVAKHCEQENQLSLKFLPLSQLIFKFGQYLFIVCWFVFLRGRGYPHVWLCWYQTQYQLVLFVLVLYKMYVFYIVRLLHLPAQGERWRWSRTSSTISWRPSLHTLETSSSLPARTTPPAFILGTHVVKLISVRNLFRTSHGPLVCPQPLSWEITLAMIIIFIFYHDLFFVFVLLYFLL